MSSAIRRVVFDCNIFLQSILNKNGPAARCKQWVDDGKIILFVSQAVLSEIRALPQHRKLARFRSLTDERIEAYIANLLPKSVLVSLTDVPRQFDLPRDPKDAHYVDLAVAAHADYLVSRDKDLLDLTTGTDPVSLEFRTRFPGLRILTPVDLIRELETII